MGIECVQLPYSIIECCALMCSQATQREERERYEVELQKLAAEHKAEKEVHLWCVCSSANASFSRSSL